jgi:hypothetical protein
MLVAHMPPEMFAELKKGSAETLIMALLEEGPTTATSSPGSSTTAPAGACRFTSPTSTPRSIASNARV